MLVVDITLVNLRFDGRRLVRRDPAAPTLVVVALPPQHVLEQSFEQIPGIAPVFAATAGTSSLAFSVPATLDGLELSLTSLLDWSSLVAMTVPVGLPGPDTPDSTVFQGIPRSVIEFPTRLLITYAEPVGWAARTDPQQADGRTALWHARLLGTQNGDVLLRAFARATVGERGPLPDGSPLADQDLQDIVTLTSGAELTVPAGGAPVDVPSAPLHSDQFIVTPLGASAHLHGDWDIPPETDGSPNEPAGRPLPKLQMYDHISGLGRDQYVRVVTRGHLSTGHQASLFKESKRVFAAHPNDGIIAYLQHEERIIVKQPEVQYAPTSGFTFAGREMPFRTLRITDRVTPPIQPVQPVQSDSGIFWVKLLASGTDHPFTLIGTDSENRTVSFTMPLVFVPDGGTDPGEALSTVYNEKDPAGTNVPNRRTRLMYGQTMAMAQPPADAPGSTAHAVESLTFGLGTLGPSPRPAVGLPHVSAAEVRVHAVEQFLPNVGPLPVSFDQTYLEQSMDAHPAGAYLRLATPLPLKLGEEKAGGLASPQAALSVITSQAGAVPDVFGTQQIADLFGGAKILGLIDLTQILGAIGTDDLDHLRNLGDDQIQAVLDDANGRLAVPVLRVRDMADGQGKELRYVWKTELKLPDPTKVLQVSSSSASPPMLTLDARTIRSKDAVDNTTVDGRLTDFELDFGDIRVDIADLRFRTGPGKKPDVTASGLAVSFQNDLQFINTLRSALPSDVFGAGAYVDVQPSGIVAGYKLAIPSIPLGVFNLSNLSLGAELTIPFDGTSPSFRFSVSERQHPFNLSVSLFGGGGYFSMRVFIQPGDVGKSGEGSIEIEGAIEFGGCAALDVGVAAGGVTVMAGVSFMLDGKNARLTGYLRFNGFLSVLGIVTVSIDFSVELSYERHGHQTVIRGSGHLTVSVRIAFFSKSVSIPFERTFSGSSADPSFALCMPRDSHWRVYCAAFAQ
ncbi:hypothetical protein [Streptomyces sp. MMG1121]|uniref:hypothetical protein n=1 Tax=Streptomyces sp. MMG1121 TaxID=1415544 RepID=UPI00131EBD26|nr:hypothetical protein [Streptomyces sp. MMG1121]